MLFGSTGHGRGQLRERLFRSGHRPNQQAGTASAVGDGFTGTGFCFLDFSLCDGGRRRLLHTPVGVSDRPGVVDSAFLYSYRLKRTAVWGNLTVAFVTGLAFVYGGLAVGRVGSALVVGVFAFFYHWGREIIKDVEDVEGDRALGARTLPVACGRKVAFAWATGVLVVLMGLTLVPYFLNLFSLRYLIVVVLGVDLFLGYVLFSMWRRSEPANLHRLAFLMKVDMFVGLVAVYVGR